MGNMEESVTLMDNLRFLLGFSVKLCGVLIIIQSRRAYEIIGIEIYGEYVSRFQILAFLLGIICKKNIR